MRIAIIDLGSNSVRMNIVEQRQRGVYSLIDQTKEMVRLSEGMGADQMLRAHAMDKTIAVLRLFQRMMAAYEVQRVRAVATAAVRSAQNKTAFLDRLLQETGITFEVLSGAEEAYYDYLGVINTLGLEDFYLVDIGGGSTEVAYVKNRVMVEAYSIPFGAVNITEALMGNKVTAKSLQAAERTLNSYLERLPWLVDRGIPIVGLGGTLRTLAKSDRAKRDVPMNTIHNYHLDAAWVQEFLSRLYQQLNGGLLKALPGIPKNRLDILHGGMLPLKCILKRTGAPEVVISGNGLKEGLYFEMFANKHPETFMLTHCPVLKREAPVLEDILAHSLHNLTILYNINVPHACRVKDFALTLYDAVYPQDGTPSAIQERRILSTAGILHDIGMFVDYYYHHCHGFYLALNVRIAGLEIREQVMMAYLIGMHRENKLKADWHQHQAIISEADYRRIHQLSLFLRIAEQLDRSESGVITSMEARVDRSARNLHVKLASNHPDSLELLAMERFSNALERQFQLSCTTEVVHEA